MLSIFSGSIRAKLALVVLLAVLPALGVIVFAGLETRKDAIADAERETLILAQTMAEMQERITAATRQLLTTLALTPEIQALDPAASSALFARLISQDTTYANIAAVDLNGDLYASALPFSKVNLADRKHMKDALASLAFSTGEYIVSRTAFRSVFTFSYPVLDAAGKPKAVLFAVLDLDFYRKLFAATNLPEGSMMGVTDHQGVRLYYYPPNNEINPIGKPIRRESWEEAVAGDEKKVSWREGSDGIRRAYAFRKLRLTPEAAPYMYVFVGFLESQILAKADDALRRNVALEALAVLIALAAAWLIGKTFLVNKVNQLVRASQRLGAGDLDARSGLASERGEIGVLATTFDSMAESLSSEIAAQRESEQALRESERNLNAIIESSPAAIFLVDAAGRISFANRQTNALFSTQADQLLGMAYVDLVHPAQRDAANAKLKALATGEAEVYNHERRYLAADGREFVGVISGQRLARPDGSWSSVASRPATGILTGSIPRWKEAD